MQGKDKRKERKRLPKGVKKTLLHLALLARRVRRFIEDKVNTLQERLFLKRKLQNYVLVTYLIKELLLYFFVAFLFFFMIFFCNQILLLAEQILKKKVPLGQVCKLILYTLPSVIAQSAPFATLVGFLMCLGRLMSDNEILIIRASGQSYIIVIVPVLIMGLVISIFSFFVNDYLLPIGTINYNKLYRQIIASNPGIEIESNTIKRLNESTIVIGNVSGGIVNDLVFFDTGKDRKQRIIVAGDSAIKNTKQEGVLMQMSMDDCVVTILDKRNEGDYDVLIAKNAALNIFDSAIFGNEYSTTPREMTSYDLSRTIRSMRQDEDTSPRLLNRYVMEYNKKFSLPFGSIFFAFLSLPLAFIFGKHKGQTIGLVMGLFICFLYWTMMILGQLFSSRNGLNGFVMMWIPNWTIGLAGSVFYFFLNQR